ncbi:hypothetical protein AVEN_167075-1 [Araneus ventricosus]|uniref:Uncharacterized protein n=1 Tax=Araneus ventricosus TaxID=182803 RepID=A0A4Y2CQW6_ARAVE|nr:hypothetical protein AVEN_167075-1 [Araneus ventricosus]
MTLQVRRRFAWDGEQHLNTSQFEQRIPMNSPKNLQDLAPCQLFPNHSRRAKTPVYTLSNCSQTVLEPPGAGCRLLDYVDAPSVALLPVAGLRQLVSGKGNPSVIRQRGIIFKIILLSSQHYDSILNARFVICRSNSCEPCTPRSHCRLEIRCAILPPLPTHNSFLKDFHQLTMKAAITSLHWKAPGIV